ncbi:MAG: T9SS type A sorting domain-containing protein [Bacteroidota bacterium]
MKNVISFTILIVCISVVTSVISFSQNNWTKLSTVAPNTAINELAVNSLGQIYAATNGKGLQRSTDGGNTWARLDSGSMRTYYYSVYINNDTNIFAGSYTGVGYRSRDFGATWKKFYLGDSTTLVTAFAVDKRGKIYGGTCGSGLFTSNDNGTTWDTIPAPDYPTPPIYPYITSIIIDQRENVLAGTYGGGMYRSKDQGNSWTRDFNHEYLRVNSLAAGANNRIFAGTDLGVLYDSLGRDTVWDSTKTRIIKIDTARTELLQDSSGLFYWTDPVFHVNLLLNVFSVVGTPGGHLYGATFGHGVFRSNDNGNHWQRWSTGITDSTVNTLVMDDSGYIYAGTTSGGFYKSTSRDTTMVAPVQTHQQILRPALAVLEQNYPNPFNPSTVIPFTLHQNSYTTLIIYDILGKEVVRLVDGMVNAGKHEIKWDATSMPSGVYFYRFQTTSVVKTGKLLLIK